MGDVLDNKRDEDDILYAAFLAGDTEAFDRLILKNSDTLTSFLKGFLYSWQDAEDLMVEAFARLLAGKPRIREGNFKAYLYKTARHLIARFYSKDRRRKVFSLDDEESGESIDPGFDAQLYENLWQDEKKRVLRACLEKIPSEMREALWLVYFDEMSYEQAASVMNVGRKKIDNLLSRGKKYLKEELEKEGITSAD